MAIFKKLDNQIMRPGDSQGSVYHPRELQVFSISQMSVSLARQNLADVIFLFLL